MSSLNHDLLCHKANEIMNLISSHNRYYLLLETKKAPEGAF